MQSTFVCLSLFCVLEDQCLGRNGDICRKNKHVKRFFGFEFKFEYHLIDDWMCMRNLNISLHKISVGGMEISAKQIKAEDERAFMVPLPSSISDAPSKQVFFLRLEIPSRAETGRFIWRIASQNYFLSCLDVFTINSCHRLKLMTGKSQK
jgi:hypothetical protein